MEQFLRIMLGIHIAGGSIALLSGMGAMLTKKGSTVHRRFGKTYFFAMTIVFLGALALAIGHQKDFLLMVAFFSYYMTVRGYRILFLKDLSLGRGPARLDVILLSISLLFCLILLGWGLYAIVLGSLMGVAGIVFGLIGLSFIIQDIRNFRTPPKEKMHWWFTHIASMGGSYISAVTAFIVVNIQIPGYNWVLWVLPSLIGGILIRRAVQFYKAKFGGAKA